MDKQEEEDLIIQPPASTLLWAKKSADRGTSAIDRVHCLSPATPQREGGGWGGYSGMNRQAGLILIQLSTTDSAGHTGCRGSVLLA